MVFWHWKGSWNQLRCVYQFHIMRVHTDLYEQYQILYMLLVLIASKGHLWRHSPSHQKQQLFFVHFDHYSTIACPFEFEHDFLWQDSFKTVNFLVILQCINIYNMKILPRKSWMKILGQLTLYIAHWKLLVVPMFYPWFFWARPSCFAMILMCSKKRQNFITAFLPKSRLKFNWFCFQKDSWAFFFFAGNFQCSQWGQV